MMMCDHIPAPWHHTGRNAERGHLMSLLLIAPHDGKIRWQGCEAQCPVRYDRLGPLHGTAASFKHIDTKAEVRSWTGCILLFSLIWVCQGLALYLPLCWGTARKKSQTHWNLARICMFIFLLSLSQALVCQKGIQRGEKRAWQNRSTFSFRLYSLPEGPNWSSVLRASPFFCWRGGLAWF